MVVLSADWILDSLDAQTLLPSKFYIVRGVNPPLFNWSMTFLYLTDRDLLHAASSWIKALFTTTPKTTSSKRPLEDENAGKSRKKRLSVAVSEVEAALSRLREVTANIPISTGESVAESIEPEVTETMERAVVLYTGPEETTSREKSMEDGTVVKEESLEYDPQIDLTYPADSEISLNDSERASTDQGETQSNSDNTDFGGFQSLDFLDWGEFDSGDENEMIPDTDDAFDWSQESSHGTPSPQDDDEERQPTSDLLIEPSPSPPLAAFVFPPSPCYRPYPPFGDYSPIFPSSSPSSDLFIPRISLSPDQSHVTSRSTSPSKLPDLNFTKKSEGNNGAKITDSVEESTPVRSVFPIEKLHSFVTPRSPARQSRLEQRSKLKRLIHDYHLAELTSAPESPIYLPQLKSTSPDEHDTLSSTSTPSSSSDESQDQEEVKVWDAKILKSDSWGYI